MRDIALFLAAFFFTYLGFAFLALAMTRHWREALGRERGNAPPGRGTALTLRILGSIALLASFWIALYQNGPSFGSTLWVVLLSLGALGVVATLTWRPSWLRPVARIFYRPASA